MSKKQDETMGGIAILVGMICIVLGVTLVCFPAGLITAGLFLALIGIGAAAGSVS